MASVMTTPRRTATTDMQVTSIRLESELKDKLRAIAGESGYQALIRDILWQYVDEHSQEANGRLSRSQIRSTIAATSQREEHCALTGKTIAPQQQMWLGLTESGKFVPIDWNNF
jgi:metal-responsive CopG/Arc/MetJ family transcriptional regulator